MKRIFFLFLFAWKILAAQEQPRFKQDQMLWLGYYNTINFNSKWSLNSDLQGRTKDWYKTLSQALLRTGISYKTSDRISITVGIAHFRYFLADNVTRGEWRPFEEFGINDKLGKVKVLHRFRIEQRFNESSRNNQPTNDYQFNHRFRYKLEFRIPLKTENLQLVIGNELMINAGSNVNGNYFDQNRLFGGVLAEMNKKISFQLQYMHIWQQLSNTITIDNMEILRFNIYHTISL